MLLVSEFLCTVTGKQVEMVANRWGKRAVFVDDVIVPTGRFSGMNECFRAAVWEQFLM